MSGSSVLGCGVWFERTTAAVNKTVNPIEVKLGPLERGVLLRDGQPVVFLRPGVHRYWTVDASVRLSVFDVREVLPSLTKELEALIPRAEYVAVTVESHERGLRFEQGRLAAVLGPGRYNFWTHPEAEVKIGAVDMRRTEAATVILRREETAVQLAREPRAPDGTPRNSAPPGRRDADRGALCASLDARKGLDARSWQK